MREKQDPYIFSAYANSVGAFLKDPLKAFLSDVPCAALPVNGGMISQIKENIQFKIESTPILRIGRASATVLGEYRNDHFVSLASSTVEKINILDVITADAIVSRVTSVYNREHSQVKFSLTGSHFDNLKVDGRALDCPVQGRFKEDFEIRDLETLRQSILSDSSEISYRERLPQFGNIHLGELNIYGGKVILTMLRVELGCPFSGSVSVPTTSTNGRDA